MPGDIQLGDNYSVEEDTNNNLVITHTPSGSTLTFDDASELFEFAAEARFGQALTDTNGKTIYDPTTSTVGDGTTSADHQSVSTEQIGNERHYAGGYDGADADARLDAALSAASSGHTIYLEAAEYGDARTIAKDLDFVGVGSSADSNSRINAAWTCTGRVILDKVSVQSSGTVELQESLSTIINSFNSGDSTVTIAANQCRLVNVTGADVTFQAGTSGGVVDASTGVTVTDNGTNTVGNIG